MYNLNGQVSWIGDNRAKCDKRGDVGTAEPKMKFANELCIYARIRTQRLL
jgi:hypothetical protein